MLRVQMAGVLVMSALIISCGNKGDLFLKSETAVETELEQIDNSIDELDQMEQEPGSAVPSTDETEKDDDEDEKGSKNGTS